MQRCPDHLRVYPWYLPHQAWLGDLARHDPEGAVPARAALARIDLHDADLYDAGLTDADFRGARLRGVRFHNADLRRADLIFADLSYAGFYAVRLGGARLPDGRSWEAYAADPLALLVPAPDARARAIAAWGRYMWGTCPLSAAYGWRRHADVPPALYRDAAAFMAIYDALLLPHLVA